MHPSLRLLVTLALAPAALLLSGCSSEGCLNGEEGCRIPTPCAKLAFQCATSGSLQARRLTAADANVTEGTNALASAGDYYLTNGNVRAVISGPGNQNYVDVNGGSLIDLAAIDDNGKYIDVVNQIVPAVGILPGDIGRYERFEIINDTDLVAIQAVGHLAGSKDVRVATRWELRKCDPGIRIRSEIFNGSPDNQLIFPADGYYWSKREPIPFTPAAGRGFKHDSFGLSTINEVFETFPYVTASIHATPYSSHTTVACNAKTMEGFQSESISAAGLVRQVLPPREFTVFERFITVAGGDDAAASIDPALEVRRQLFGEEFVTLSGDVDRLGGDADLGSEREVSIQILEAGPIADQRTPWSQVVPGADGSFSARVPKGKSYDVEVWASGRPVVERRTDPLQGDTNVGKLEIPSTARVTLRLGTVLGGTVLVPTDGEVFVIPADAATRDGTTGSFHEQYGACSPWLGPPPGASPACNKVLISRAEQEANGGVAIEIPPGNYTFYGFHGPFWTLARQTVNLPAAAATITLDIEELPGLRPTGALSADMHIHGAASFDSSLPDYDRVQSFVSSDLDVAISTDHDVVYDYAAEVGRRGFGNQLTTVVGLETTGHNPYLYVPGYGYPLVIGHYNFWPMKYDPSQPRNGGPFDEFLEPGQLFDRIEDNGMFSSATPVIQLNHPYADPEFGRDLGFPRAIYLDNTRPYPAEDDGTNSGVWARAQGRNRNNSHHVQEVMNGTQNDLLLPYRAFWFHLLNQGQLRGGTANSDSHSIHDNTVGSPRTLVLTTTNAGSNFNVETFNQAVRSGRMYGTNGPLLEATLDAAGGARSFGLTPFTPAANAMLHLRVTAAPWVPVDELRIVVNGKVVRKITPTVAMPDDPFGTAQTLRYVADLPLSELVTGTADAWLVVEAGMPLSQVGDLGGGLNGIKDGIPDTTDNNEDGVVDRADVGSGRTIGPLRNPDLPTDGNDPRFHFTQVVHGGFPMAFTNPFILDVNGNGVFDAPGPQELE